jgi:hypothetical protein
MSEGEGYNSRPPAATAHESERAFMMADLAQMLAADAVAMPNDDRLQPLGFSLARRTRTMIRELLRALAVYMAGFWRVFTRMCAGCVHIFMGLSFRESKYAINY